MSEQCPARERPTSRLTRHAEPGVADGDPALRVASQPARLQAGSGQSSAEYARTHRTQGPPSAHRRSCSAWDRHKSGNARLVVIGAWLWCRCCWGPDNCLCRAKQGAGRPLATRGGHRRECGCRDTGADDGSTGCGRTTSRVRVRALRWAGTLHLAKPLP